MPSTVLEALPAPGDLPYWGKLNPLKTAEPKAVPLPDNSGLTDGSLFMEIRKHPVSFD